MPKNPSPLNKMLYTGRFEFSDPTKIVFSHVGCSIKANFSGTGISATLASESSEPSATSYLYVIVDGKVAPETRNLIEVSAPSRSTFNLVSDLPYGNHSVELVKETEYDTKVAFYGFTVNDGSLLAPPERPPLRLEFYGDSNPAGWGAYDPLDAGAVISNGGYYNYPSVTARLLNAECFNNSMGGVGITDKAWRNLANFYHLIHMNDAPVEKNLWHFDNDPPTVVVINASSNDHSAGATKAEIKSGWKNFVGLLRGHYPTVPIVIAESYGWSYNEPADYLEETVAEIKAEGDLPVSFVKFPWLWGQQHTLINEHAGFANILAEHLAVILNLPQPIPSRLSSFAPYGHISNGSFEKTSIPGVPDGWRPFGEIAIIEDAADAIGGSRFLRLYRTATVHFANHANPGSEFTVTGWMRSARNGDVGKLKLEFKDQAQNTLGTNEGPVTLTMHWQKFSTAASAPPGTWSVWVVVESDASEYIDVDDVQMNCR